MYIIYISGNMDENGQWNGMIKELVEKVCMILYSKY